MSQTDKIDRATILGKFPSTRYQGSKRKILPWIWESLRELDFCSALDVFGGTSSVSYLLKRMGKEVTYNDFLKFNFYIGVALLENDAVRLNSEDIGSTLAGLAEEPPGFVANTFGGIYFTDAENRWIDGVVARISALSEVSRDSRYKKALLYYGLFQSCLIKRPYNLFHRRNLYFRFADVKRSFCNKVSWDRPFEDRFRAFCTAASDAVFKGQRKCLAICHEALEIPDKHYDLIYIDPPYLTSGGRNSSADYLMSYHFLEGLCSHNSWSARIDYSTVNLRMKSDGVNAWNDRNQQLKSLDSLLEKYESSIIVISYKRFGVPSIDTLIRMLKRHGRRVRSRSRHYKYALNHQNGDAKLNREVLLIAE